MSWFKALSKSQQAAYLKKHPNSKYAKGSKSSKRSAAERKKGPMANLSKMTKEDRRSHKTSLRKSHRKHLRDANPNREDRSKWTMKQFLAAKPKTRVMQMR